MTVFNSSNISEFENQQFVGLEGEVVTLKELCSKANLRMLFDHSEVLKPYTLTLIDDDWVSCANVVFRRRNYENATRDVLKYVNDKLNNNSWKVGRFFGQIWTGSRCAIRINGIPAEASKMLCRYLR